VLVVVEGVGDCLFGAHPSPFLPDSLGLFGPEGLLRFGPNGLPTPFEPGGRPASARLAYRGAGSDQADSAPWILR